MPSKEESLEFMRKNNIKWVALHFLDLDGGFQHKVVSSSDVDEEIFSKGIQSDVSEIYGYSKETLSLIPDSDTFARVPWEPNTMRLISNIYSMPEGERFVKDCRHSIERVNINAEALGISDVRIGSDIEFYLFDNVTVDKSSREGGSAYVLNSREAVWNPSPLWNKERGAFLCQPQDTFYAARVQIAQILEEQFHYAVHSHDHGRSPNAQQKIRLRECNAKIAADGLATLKYAIRNVAYIANNIATFMPLPIANDKGNSINITQKLSKGTKNLFYDKDEEYGKLSQTALYYIGGILEHAEALSVFTTPTTNSYKKLKTDPRYIAFSKTNPNALIYVPELGGEQERNITYTGADSSINPYLAYTAVVAAGLDGIKNKIDCGKPIDENLFEMSEKDRKTAKVKLLPSNILEAISALEKDSKFLKGFVAPELLADYLAQKIFEHNENEKRPTAFEIDKYFNR